MTLSQLRLFIRGSENDCNLAMDLLADWMEEEGLPLATMEVDEKRDLWETSVYVDEADADDVRAVMQTRLAKEFPDIVVDTETLPEIDWVSRSLEGLKPVRAGRFVVFGSHDRATARAHEHAIEIDAGQAFGTGHHGTTAGCLEMIGRLAKSRHFANALDLGTGSGVLAIALARQGLGDILATDIDPVAVEVARCNSKLNETAAAIDFATAAGFHSAVFVRKGPFDLIVANILARPLMKMAPSIARHLAPGGSVVLSGILAGQRWKVLAAFAGQGLYHRHTLWREGWVTLHLSANRK